jgi:hypothetical protein
VKSLATVNLTENEERRTNEGDKPDLAFGGQDANTKVKKAIDSG